MNTPMTTDPAPAPHAERPASSWAVILRRSIREVKRDDLPDRAAALTYFGVLSLFPAALVLVSLLGIIDADVARRFVDSIRGAAPGDVARFVENIVTQVQGSMGTSGAVAIVAILVALWSASRYVAAFTRASNAVYGVPEGRPLWKTLALRLWVTIAVAVLLVVCAVIVVVTGPIADTVGRMIGVGNGLRWVWNIAKWPVLVIVVALLFSLLFSATPNVKYGRFRLLTAGGVIAVILWLIFSGLFAVYLGFSGSYSRVYGPLSTVIVFLVWLWLSNIAVLLGLEFDSERERERVIRDGAPPRLEPYVHVRDHRAMDGDERRRVEAAEELIPEPSSHATSHPRAD
jgi:membrane protein